jgi:hypothetical protein
LELQAKLAWVVRQSTSVRSLDLDQSPLELGGIHKLAALDIVQQGSD